MINKNGAVRTPGVYDPSKRDLTGCPIPFIISIMIQKNKSALAKEVSNDLLKNQTDIPKINSPIFITINPNSRSSETNPHSIRAGGKFNHNFPIYSSVEWIP